MTAVSPELIDFIRSAYRMRRWVIKQISGIERSLESFVVHNYVTIPEGTVDLKPLYKQADKIIKPIKKALKPDKNGKITPPTDVNPELLQLVMASLIYVNSLERMKVEYEKDMERLAKTLPAASFVEGVRGAGLGGLAQIVGLAGDLSNYPNVAKLWKRLGMAPYEGHAMSTWKRPSWRSEGSSALTKEEWIANPFSGERYAPMFMIADSLQKAQWIGAKKNGGIGKPNGHYAQIYADRRAHTNITHPDWTPKHSQMDGLRIMVKDYVADLWSAWRETTHALKSIQSLSLAT